MTVIESNLVVQLNKIEEFRQTIAKVSKLIFLIDKLQTPAA